MMIQKVLDIQFSLRIIYDAAHYCNLGRSIDIFRLVS